MTTDSRRLRSRAVNVVALAILILRGGTSFGATLTMNTPPTLTPGALSVPPGGTLTFTVANGPAKALDWVGLYCPDTTGDGGYGTNWKYLNNSQMAPAMGSATATVTFAAPMTPGQTCNARLFQNNGMTKLATSALVTIKGPSRTASLVTDVFTVTVTDGPLVGQTAFGLFSFNPAIIPPGGGLVNGPGLFSDFSFYW